MTRGHDLRIAVRVGVAAGHRFPPFVEGVSLFLKGLFEVKNEYILTQFSYTPSQAYIILTWGRIMYECISYVDSHFHLPTLCPDKGSNQCPVENSSISLPTPLRQISRWAHNLSSFSKGLVGVKNEHVLTQVFYTPSQ